MNEKARLTGEFLAIARLCSIECKLQMSGENSVHWMLAAWAHAQDLTGPLDHEDILAIGRHVEPVVNGQGYRRINVRVGSNVKPHWELVPGLMTDLLDKQGDFEPDEWFYEYENVHPFGDGNGRSGVVLFNYLARTLDDPEWPPDFWHDERRIPGAGAPL